MIHDVGAVATRFRVPGKFLHAKPYGTGHINDTYLAEYVRDGRRMHCILQRINHNVFRNPKALMDNISRVTEHQKRILESGGCPSPERHALTIVPAVDGASWYQDGDGNAWRTYIFIDRARTYDIVDSPDMAYRAGRAFGEFQRQMLDLPGTRLTETIPDFHNTPKRFAALVDAINADPLNRAAGAKAEIDFALAQEPLTAVLLERRRLGDIPERVTHNDTKLNNVLIDDATGEGICVIDLDTVMHGLALYDFGDMIRADTRPSAEDERNLDKVFMDMSLFKGLVRGYMESAGGFLTKTERSLLAFSGKLISIEIAIRFLTDYLSGDVYFKIHRPGHNLDRCRAQSRLARSIAEQEDAMNRVVESLGDSGQLAATELTRRPQEHNTNDPADRNQEWRHPPERRAHDLLRRQPS